MRAFPFIIRASSLTAALTAFMPLVTSPSVAQDSRTCQCVLPATNHGTPVGEVLAVQGDVMMSASQGYRSVGPKAPVFQDSTIIVGQSASASLALGRSCRVNLPSGAKLQLSSGVRGICVSMSSPQAGTPWKLPVLGLVGAGILGGAGAAVASQLNDDDDFAIGARPIDDRAVSD